MAKPEIKPVSDGTIQYLQEIAAVGVELAMEGQYSLNLATEIVDKRRATQRQLNSSLPKTLQAPRP